MSELRKKIHDDNNGLDYVLVGDYYLPVLSLPEETRPIGCWGMLRKEYLKEHKSGMYSCLLLTARLDSHLADVNEQAQERFELIEAQMGNIFGYIRVSSRDQKEDRQLIALKELAIPEKNIFIDKQSGKDFKRPQYRKMIRRVRKDDLLYIKSIDRLGRNYAEILEQWRILTKDKGIDIVVLDMPLLDTRRGKDLMGTFLSDIVLQVLSFVAENERTNIRQRQAEGIAAAKARGVRFGRPPSRLPDNFHDVYQRWKNGKITGTSAAKECNMPLSTFRYRAEIYEKAKLL